MKKILLIIIIGICFFSFTSAIDYTGAQYENISIIETCVVNGFPCPNDFVCNITIVNPDNEIVTLNSQMTKNDTTYYYFFTKADVLGDYNMNVFCCNATRSGNADSILVVTTTGRKTNPTLTIVILGAALALFIIALVIKSHPVGFISGVLMLISGINILIYGLTYINDMYTRSIALVILSFGLFIMFISGIEWLEDME